MTLGRPSGLPGTSLRPQTINRSFRTLKVIVSVLPARGAAVHRPCRRGGLMQVCELRHLHNAPAVTPDRVVRVLAWKINF